MSGTGGRTGFCRRRPLPVRVVNAVRRGNRDAGPQTDRKGFNRNAPNERYENNVCRLYVGSPTSIVRSVSSVVLILHNSSELLD